MGMTFGSQVLDWGLTTRSCWHEFLSLLLAVMIGAVIGVTTSFCPSADTWPTEQMSSRGDTTGLIAGIAIGMFLAQYFPHQASLEENRPNILHLHPSSPFLFFSHSKVSRCRI